MTPLVINVLYVDSHAAHAFAQQLATSIGSSLIKVQVSIVEKSKWAEKPMQKAMNIDILSAFESSSSDIAVEISQPDHPAVWFPHRRQFTFNPLRLRLKSRRIPLTRYAVQVLLFLLISLLNNAAFAYHVPMAVHIIFRSGGLVVNMLMGRILENRRSVYF